MSLAFMPLYLLKIPLKFLWT
uniref:Uncharacterized protein n=1 Tax=Rhizophora mucronata TaxID=61149 RepID=A0A2P2PDK1_RHIMU